MGAAGFIYCFYLFHLCIYPLDLQESPDYDGGANT